MFPLQRATKNNEGGQGARKQKTSSKIALSSLMQSISGSREGACTSPGGNEQGVGCLDDPWGRAHALKLMRLAGPHALHDTSVAVAVMWFWRWDEMDSGTFTTQKGKS